jgi:hypothetical protein
MKLSNILFFVLILTSSCNEINNNRTGQLPIFNKDTSFSVLPDTIKVGPLEILKIYPKASTYEAARDSCKSIGLGWRLPTKLEMHFISYFKMEFNKSLDDYNYWVETDNLNERIFGVKPWGIIVSTAHVFAVKDNPDSASYRNSNDNFQQVKSMMNFTKDYELAIIKKRITKEKFANFQIHENRFYFNIEDSGSKKIVPLTNENVSVIYTNMLSENFVPISTTLYDINREDWEFFLRLLSKIGPGGRINVIAPKHLLYKNDPNYYYYDIIRTVQPALMNYIISIK